MLCRPSGDPGMEAGLAQTTTAGRSSGRRRWGGPPAPAAPLGPPVSSELQRVQACVGQLSRREQGVVSLRFDAALSSQEIGLVMGMTEVEGMVVVLRSLRRVKACLEAGAGGAAPPTRR